MDKGLTEIQEVTRGKIKITFQRQRGHYGAFFHTLKELQRIDVILLNVRFWHTVKLIR